MLTRRSADRPASDHHFSIWCSRPRDWRHPRAPAPESVKLHLGLKLAGAIFLTNVLITQVVACFGKRFGRAEHGPAMIYIPIWLWSPCIMGWCFGSRFPPCAEVTFVLLSRSIIDGFCVFWFWWEFYFAMHYWRAVPRQIMKRSDLTFSNWRGVFPICLF